MDSSSESEITPNEDEQAFLFARQLVGGSYFLPMVLRSAIELDLLEILARAGGGKFLSPDEIAAELPTRNPEAGVMLDRILRFLASYSVLKCNTRVSKVDGKVERLYGLAPVCKYLTKNEDGVSMVPLLMMNQDRAINERWSYLKDAVLEGGIPFNMAFNMSIFEFCATDQRFNKIFNEAMSNHSTIIVKKVLETYTGFEGLSSLVDVGGGIGATLNLIISKYPSVRGINYDLPHVISNAPAFPGVEHVGGDMFSSVPKGDAIFMKGICHDWTDEKCLKILKNCYDALPEKGKVIVVEYLLCEYPDTSLKTKNVFSVDLLMSVDTPNGKERTEKEFKALAMSAGFAEFRVVGYAHSITVMEFLKNA